MTDKHIRDLNRETERKANASRFLSTVLMLLTLAAMLFLGVMSLLHH